MSRGDGKTLPVGWKLCKITEVAHVNPALDRCIVADDVVVDFIPMRAVEEEGGGILRPEVSTYAKVRKGYTAFLPGDVIMAKITPCMENGKTCVVPHLPHGVCFGSTEFHVVRVEEGVEGRWIAYFLLQHATRHAAQRQMTGGVGQMRVPAGFLEALSLPVPSHAEQRRILDVLDELLSDVDAGLRALERVQAKVRQYRAAVLKASVEGALSAEWREANADVEPGPELLKRILAERRRRWEEAQLKKYEDARKEPPKNWKEKYKEPSAPVPSKLPTLPEKWCWVTIEQLSMEVRNGYSQKPTADAGTPILRISAVRPFKLDLNDRRYLVGAAEKYAADVIKSGDLLFTRYNGSRNLVGVSAVVPQIVEEIVHPDKLIRARPVPIVATPSFFAIAANVGFSRKYMEQRIRTTAGQAGISGGDVKGLPIPLPSLEEQAAIVELVEDQLSVIDHLESDLEAKLKDATALRQSILKAAFEGKLVPQNLNDDPASELLRRIAAERAERERLAKEVKKATKRCRPKRGHNVSTVSAG
jgi:type I restriction enzyme, S subunit